MMSARSAAQIVPKTRGQTYTQKLDASLGSVPAGAAMAGMLWMIRKIATAARVARMSEPATTVLVEKTRSPRRTLASECATGAQFRWSFLAFSARV